MLFVLVFLKVIILGKQIMIEMCLLSESESE